MDNGQPSPRPNFLLTLLWSDDAELVARADAAGIDRIGLDIESLGKGERQKNRGSWVSPHRLDDLARLRGIVRQNELFCRLNPIHSESRAEVDRAVDCGVDVLMLPMFTTATEVATFVALVAGRAKVVPLLEHRLAADCVDEVTAIDGLDCLHVGLTDLALSLGVRNRFSLLASALLDRIAEAAHRRGLRLCVGGIGRAMDASLPISTDLIYAQYPRLNATGALVSRAFFGRDPLALDVTAEVAACRERMAHWQRCDRDQLEAARQEFMRATAMT